MNERDGGAASMTETWKQWEGQIVDGAFPLQKYVGGSGHSVVFLTEYSGQEPQKAAIKLVSAAANAEEQLSNWARGVKLSHPHLLRTFASGRWQLKNTALIYVVMEYAEEDLSQILPIRPLTPPEAQEMLPPVLEALAYLHGQGLVHGRLKPTNIMAVGDQVKLSSDGIWPAGTSNAGMADSPEETLYRAPETANRMVGPSADVWALGITLVEVLTLRRPTWSGAGSTGVDGADPVLPDGIPNPLLDITRHCLQRDPRRRWTITEIASHLQEHTQVGQKTIAVAKPEKSTPPARELKKASAKWTYLVPIAAAIILLVALISGRKHASPPPSPLAESQQAPPFASSKLPDQPKSKPTPARPANTDSVSRAGSPQRVERAEAPSSRPKAAARSRVAGAVLHQVLPQASPGARATIQGHVRVRVKARVDASGNVVETSFDSAGPSKYFARLALQAAKEWKFTPPQVNGQAVPSEWILQFAFGRTATDAHAIQKAP